MGEWLQSLVPWGTEALIWIQSVRSDALVAAASFFTFLGYEEFYVFLLPLIYWCVHKQAGIALGYLAMICTWASNAVKYVFQIPRPADPRLIVLRPETSPSFLSGHATSAVGNWGYLAARVRRGWAWALALVLMAGIGLSRLILGVHFPQDVVGGWLLGALLLAAYGVAAPAAGRRIARQPVPVQLALAVAGPALLILLHPPDVGGGYPNGSAVKPMAATIGLGVGVVMEGAWLRFRVAGPWLRRVARFLAGLAVVAAIYAGPKLALPDGLPYTAETALAFVRYALVGWVTAFLCPWLFVRLGLAEREQAAPGTLEAMHPAHRSAARP